MSRRWILIQREWIVHERRDHAGMLVASEAYFGACSSLSISRRFVIDLGWWGKMNCRSIEQGLLVICLDFG